MSGDRKRVVLLTAIMAAACLLVSGYALIALYRTHINHTWADLVLATKSQARLIGEIALHESENAATIRQYIPDYDPDVAVLKQIRDAHEGFGETGEFTLARQRGDSIVFQFRHRLGQVTFPGSVPFNSELAEPMRRALSGLTGTMTGRDYRGEIVMAAYEPVGALDLGIVAKIDLAEVRAPYYRAAMYALSITVAVLLLGMFLFHRVSSPMLRRLEEHTQDLEREVDRRGVVETDLRRSTNELQIRNDIKKAFLTLPEDRLYKTVLEIILDALESEDGVLGHIDHEGSLVIAAVSPTAMESCRIPDEGLVFTRKEWGDSHWARAMRTQKPVLANDPSLAVPEGHIVIRRHVTVPIVFEGESVGMITAANKKTDYAEEDLRFLGTIAESLAPIFGHRLQTELSERRQKETEAKLHESQQRYRRLFETSSDAIMIFEAETRRMVDANSAALELYGYTREEFLQLHQSDLTAEPEKSDSSIQETLDGTLTHIPERLHRKRDGTMFPVEISACKFPYRDRTLVCGVNRDITVRKKAEDALQESYEIINQSPAVAFLWRNAAGWPVEYTSENVRSLFGYTAEDFMTGRVSYEEIIHPEDLERVREEVARLSKDKERTDFVHEPYRIITAGGQVRWIDDRTSIRRDQSGEATHYQGIVLDITERRKAEEEITLLSQAARMTKDPITIVDLNGNVANVNNAMLRQYRFPDKQSVIGTPVMNLVAPEDKEAAAVHMRKTWEKGEHGGEFLAANTNGETFLVEVSVTLMKDVDDKATGLVAITRDITERKRAEKKLRDVEANLRNTFDISPGLICVADANTGYFVECNLAVTRILGFSVEEFTSRPFKEFIHPDDWQKTVDEIAGQLRGHPTAAFENRYRCKDGSYKPLSWQVTAADKKGIVYAVATDITERRKAEEALRESRAKIALHLRSTPLAVIEFDPDGRVTEWNPAAARMFGYSREEILGQRVDMLVHESARGQVAAVIAALRNGTGGKYSTNENVTKDGSTIVCRWYNTPLVDKEGRVYGAASIVEDITELKQAEETLLEYQERLRALTYESALSEERERRRLAGQLHDLVAQPLAFAMLKLGTLEQGTEAIDGRKIAEQIGHQIDEAVRCTRALTSELSPPILYELGFTEAIEWLCEQTGSVHDIPTTFREDGAPLPLDKDVEITLFQAVRELLANVVKHSRSQTAGVTIHQIGENVEIEVRDEGVGLDPAKAGLRHADEGGFGLFAIQERLNLMGGSIEIRSGEGGGSRIILRAPVKHEETQQRGTAYEYQDTARG